MKNVISQILLYSEQTGVLRKRKNLKESQMCDDISFLTLFYLSKWGNNAFFVRICCFFQERHNKFQMLLRALETIRK